MYSLKNKIVLITGASSGIGAASAKEFAKRGAKLILIARRKSRLEKLAEELKSLCKTKFLLIELDVRNRKKVTAAIKNIPTEWKSISILLNNAGLASGLNKFQEADVDDWEKMIDTNIKGLLYVTREILPKMIEQNEGHIINIGSIAGHFNYPNGNVYSATKFAVNSLTQGLRMDLFGTPIRVSSVDPGMVETEFSLVRFHGDATRAKKTYEGTRPLSAKDIAETIIFCATRPPHVNIQDVIIMPTDQAALHLVRRD